MSESGQKTDNHNDSRVEDGSNISKSPKTVKHNISINITDTDSPVCVRRRIHLRSLSDVTPTSRPHTPRARSQSARSPPSSPSRPALPPPPSRSERSSPTRPDPAATILGNPWRKMSDVDLKASDRRRNSNRVSLDGTPADDPWVKNSRPRTETKPRREAVVVDSTSIKTVSIKRGKLERRSPVPCDGCGVDGCECRKPRSPGRPRTPRLNELRQRRASSSPNASASVEVPASISLPASSPPLPPPAPGAAPASAPATAACTCETLAPSRLSPCPSPSPSPSPSPRTVSYRALSDDDECGQRVLYKSTSQRTVCAVERRGDGVSAAADPLLETTC